jgi:hypothetical protein
MRQKIVDPTKLIVPMLERFVAPTADSPRRGKNGANDGWR